MLWPLDPLWIMKSVLRANDEMIVQRHPWLRLLAAAALIAQLGGCATVRQFPVDPEDTQASLKSYQAYFGANAILQYETAPPALRQQLRDTIAINRMLASLLFGQ